MSVISGVPSRVHYPTKPDAGVLGSGDFEVWRLLRAINLLLVAAPGAAAHAFGFPGGQYFRYVVDSPQVIISDLYVRNERALVRGDLRHIPKRVVTNFNQTPRGRAMARALRGTIDTQFEADVFATIFPDNASFSTEPSAARILERATTGPDSLRSLSETDLANLPLTPDVREGLRGQLASGHLLLGTPNPVDWRGRHRVAWWRVDLRTGATIGLLDTGLHQTGSESTVTTSEKKGETARTGPVYSQGMQQGAHGKPGAE